MAGPSRPGAKPSRRKGAGHGLDAEGLALWRKVTATVRPIDARRAATTGPVPEPGQADPPTTPPGKRRQVPAGPSTAQPAQQRSATPPDVNGLDAGWDKRLRRGLVGPDRMVDLHGHTLTTAHAALDAAIAGAVAADARLLLVVTGRPPRPGSPGRGLIRAAIPDWLAASGWASRIAAVRNAHPRHGGAGAIYLVLRRRR